MEYRADDGDALVFDVLDARRERGGPTLFRHDVLLKPYGRCAGGDGGGDDRSCLIGRAENIDEIDGYRYVGNFGYAFWPAIDSAVGCTGITVQPWRINCSGTVCATFSGCVDMPTTAIT